MLKPNIQIRMPVILLIMSNVRREICVFKKVMAVVKIIHQINDPQKKPANKSIISNERSMLLLISNAANKADKGMSVIGFDSVSMQVEIYMFKRRVAVGCACAVLMVRLKVTMPK